jgi:hypothetical protein
VAQDNRDSQVVAQDNRNSPHKEEQLLRGSLSKDRDSSRRKKEYEGCQCGLESLPSLLHTLLQSWEICSGFNLWLRKKMHLTPVVSSPAHLSKY